MIKLQNKKFPISEVEKTLKKQKLVFAFLNSANKEDSLYQNYYLPLKKLFGKTIIFDPLKITASYGYQQMEKLFVSLIKKENPEYIFINARRDELTLETLQKIRNLSPATKIVSTSGDDDKDFEPLKRYHALFMDCTIIHQINYLRNYYADGVKNIYPTLGINIEIFKPMNFKKIYDVVFVGNAIEERVETIRFLINNKINLKVFGGRWDNYPEFKQVCLGYVSPEEMAKVINQTKINLGLSKNKYGQSAFKWRVFEIASCKAFSLIDYFDGYLKFFKNNKEIIMFKNNRDLLQKINYYLKHEKERERIAKNSYKRAIKRCNILEEFKKMFKKIMENPELFSQKRLKIKEKIIILEKKDLNKSDKEIEKIINEYDYVSFSDGNSLALNYKDYLQSYSLKKTKKEISCCDYYVYDDVLGNYLTTNVYKASHNLKKEQFDQAITINQIAVTKEYFTKNLNKFKSFFEGKIIDIINKKNTCFISIPLVRIKKLNKINSDVLASSFFHKNFALDSYLLFRQKKLFTSKYFYRLLITLIKNPLIAISFIKFREDKKNWKNAISL